VLNVKGKAIAEFAAKHRLSSTGFRGFAEAGGLIGYGDGKKPRTSTGLRPPCASAFRHSGAADKRNSGCDALVRSCRNWLD